MQNWWGDRTAAVRLEALSMLSAKGGVVALLIAAALAGCKSGTAPGAAAGSGTGSGVSSASGVPGLTNGTQTVYIQDPSLNNMNAISVSIPAKWIFQGTLVQGDQCSPTPYPVFRATSPDGLTFVERMPNLNWVWGTGPMTTAQTNGCLPLKQALSAQDFLKYYSQTLKYAYMGDEPVPDAVNAAAQKNVSDAQATFAAQYAAMKVQPPKMTVQMARATVQFMNGTFTMQGQLQASVLCTETQFAGFQSTLKGMASQPGWTMDRCTAGVRFLSTQQSSYQAMANLMDTDNVTAVDVPAWDQAYMSRANQQTMKALQQIDAAGAAQRAATNAAFAHAAAVRNQNYQNFEASMQSNFNSFMNQQAQSQEARQQFTSDMVDFALDQQTVANPTTGQISKVSSSYGQTWMSTSGNTSSYFQTNNVNANPNGVIPGTWVQQTVVHGDGTAK
jgi:hypothetical protein